MMRKDVRIGFGIGALLLAVLIVYGLVTSGPQSRDVTLVADPDTPTPANLNGAGDSSPNPGNDAAAAPSPSIDARDSLASSPSGNGGAGADATGAANAPSQDAASAANGSDKWEHALTKGELPPMLMTQTPTQADAGAQPGQPAPVGPANGAAARDSAGASTPAPAGAAPDPQNTSESTGTAPGESAGPAGLHDGMDSTASAPRAHTGSSLNASELAQTVSIPATQPGEAAAAPNQAGQRTHLVQRNETFASIAEMAYGSESYYPHLMRANPNIDPKKLRAGMTIVLPPIDQVVVRDAKPGDDAQLASGTPIDEKTHYRVQLSDNLYKISLKLYGRADKVDAIYQLNQEAIGPNPSRLKPNLVLKLPEPPTQPQSTAAR